MKFKIILKMLLLEKQTVTFRNGLQLTGAAKAVNLEAEGS